MTTPTNRYNGLTVAKMIGVGESTIRRWTADFNIPFAEIGGQRLYNDQAVEVMRQIQALRDQKVNAEDIKLNIAKGLEAAGGGETSQAQKPDESPGETRRMLEELRSDLKAHSQQIAESLNAAVSESGRMADRYAESQREIGRIEALLQMTDRQLQEAKQAAKLLPEKAAALQAQEARAQKLESDVSGLAGELAGVKSALALEQSAHADTKRLLNDSQATAEGLRAQNEALQAQVKELQQALEQEQARPWWQKITKK